MANIFFHNFNVFTVFFFCFFFIKSTASGLVDSRENCWKFFIDRVRRQLKVVLCFSPVGNTLRIRSRKFPAITNCTAIDWFHEWPEEALFSVSRRFLEETEQVLVSVSSFFIRCIYIFFLEKSLFFGRDRARLINLFGFSLYIIAQIQNLI